MDPIESGEDPETGLLPNRRWLRDMPARTRDELEDLVADWVGPMVEAWRDELADLRDGEW
ncbi:MAG TPA: hypothetical protein VGH66_02750 [Acidimicrobiales bacterium]|jgi:hypothetical protein